MKINRRNIGSQASKNGARHASRTSAGRLDLSLWLISGAAAALGCGGRVQETDAADQTREASLSLVQRVDSADLPDGDESAFERADQSAALVHGRSAASLSNTQRQGACAEDPRVLLGLVSLDTCVGADLFFRESFGGNGRTCSSCHPVANNFTLDTAFIATLPDDDPLFVAETNPELSGLERPDLLRGYGLVLENVDGAQDPTHQFVMRSVSHTFSLSTSLTPSPLRPDGRTLDRTTLPPNQRTGWGGDGAPGTGTLREFALGAVEQHATKSLERVAYADFVLPTERQLDQLEGFQLKLGRENELDLLAVSMADTAAERGRVNFVSGNAADCSLCHTEAGANNIFPTTGTSNFNFDIGTEKVRPDILNEQGIPFDGGFGREPFDFDGDLVNDSFGNGTFNTQPLIEAVDTAPYFHNNAFQTLEEAIAFYTTDTFGKSRNGRVVTEARPNGGAFQLTPDEIADIGRFLRDLNAAFNCQLALARIQAAFQITDAFGNRYLSIQRGLLELAQVEIRDALRVLGAVPALNLSTQSLLEEALGELADARRSSYMDDRADHTRASLLRVSAADSALGTGIRFKIGEGTLMF